MYFLKQQGIVFSKFYVSSTGYFGFPGKLCFLFLTNFRFLCGPIYYFLQTSTIKLNKETTDFCQMKALNQWNILFFSAKSGFPDLKPALKFFEVKSNSLFTKRKVSAYFYEMFAKRKVLNTVASERRCGNWQKSANIWVVRGNVLLEKKWVWDEKFLKK